MPYLDEIIYKPIPDSEARIASLLSGDIDVNFEVAAKDVARLATSSGVTVQLTKPSGMGIFYINTRKPPLNDPKVRQALLYAFDRQNYNRDFLAGLARPANSPIAPENWAYNKDADSLYPYDPEKAKAMLAEAGFTEQKPLSLEIIYPVGLEEYKTVSEFLQASLQKAGINAKLTGMELAAWSNKIIKEKSYDVAFDMRDIFADPAMSFDDFTFFKPDAENFDGFVAETLPGYLDQVKQAKQETDQAKRAEIYKQIQQLWADNLPGWIVTQNPGTLVTSDKVQGYVIVAGRPPHLWNVWLNK
jgi:ABC-type transport system substrate-binding protein